MKSIMQNIMKAIIFITMLSTISIAFSGEVKMVNISDRIETQKFFLKVFPDLYGSAQFALSSDFKKIVNALNYKKKSRVLFLAKKLDRYIPESLLRPLLYWRIVEPNHHKSANVLSAHMLYKLLVIRDFIDSPLGNRDRQDQAVELLKRLSESEAIDSFNLFAKAYPTINKKSSLYSKFSDDKALVHMLLKEELITVKLQDHIAEMPNYSLSYLGFIPGNNVEVVSENDRSTARIDWFNERVIFNGGKLDFDSPYVKMPTKKDPTGHIAFVEDPIFQRIREMIDTAKESIFIDIFLFGGTMGATLTEYLLDEVKKKYKKNKKFRLLILHDYATNYNMVDEMLPIFLYIKKRREKESDLNKAVYLLQANIQRHPPGIPFGITEMIPKNPETFEILSKRNTYYESKIDHSKVIVIDANGKKPAAYFGSKNWTDHSGGYYYDDAIYVEGPAAALVQASYYRDIEAALTNDSKELAWFYYKDKGLDNTEYRPMSKTILKNFAVNNSSYPAVGEDVARIAEADVDGTIKNVRNILIDMIINAQDHIYMEQLFIYDKYINDALIKRKLQKPSLKIKILADHNGNFGMNGLPNTLFIKLLQDSGIEVRARRTYHSEAHFPDGTKKMYHQENHRKISSVDGKVLLGGSSNLNPDTLQGSFREFGAQIYNKKEIAQFENQFLKAWNDKKETMDLDMENYQAKIGEELIPKDLSALINDVGRHLIRSKDKIERRHK